MRLADKNIKKLLLITELNIRKKYILLYTRVFKNSGLNKCCLHIYIIFRHTSFTDCEFYSGPHAKKFTFFYK